MIKVAIMLLLVQVGLHLTGYQRLVDWITKRTPIAEVGKGSTDGKDEAAFIENACRAQALVGTAANHGFYRANCLRKAITTWWLLRKKGLNPTICFGAKKEGEGLAAHAWVELAGEPLGESSENLETYQPLESSIINPGKQV